MSTENPVALVTGAAKRVGRTIALRLADAGYDVAFTYLHSQEAAIALSEELRNKGRTCSRILADLTKPQEAVDVIEGEITTAFGRLDVLVNNASLYEPSNLRDVTLEQMRRFWAIHLESPLLLCQAFAPMLRTRRGRVINMLDLLAERPWPEYLPYSASKAAMLNLTLGLARDLAPEVTVNGISPGVVDWPNNYPQSEREQYLKRVPLARAGTPDDVADAVLFLCTSAKYITGQVLRLDGGRSLT